jgi:hypothetical protein
MQCTKPLLLYPVVVLRAGMLQTSSLNKNFAPKFGVRCTRRILDGFSSSLLVSLTSDVSIELGITQSLCCFVPSCSVNFSGNTYLNSLTPSFPHSLPSLGCLIATSPQPDCMHLLDELSFLLGSSKWLSPLTTIYQIPFSSNQSNLRITAISVIGKIERFV